MFAALPAVSVCVPTYNGAAYLRACLESILGQTFADFEVVVVDDRSTDETVDVVRAVAAADARVRLFENPRNLGLVGNWNRCVALSRAQWLKFAFQDDLLAPDCLALMLDAAASGFPVISCSRDFIFEAHTTEAGKAGYLRNRALIDAVYAGRSQMSARAFCEATLDNIGVNLVGEPTAVLLQKDVFSRFGSFDPRLITYCDAEYWTRVICHTGTFHLPEALASFRVHAGATSARNVASRAYRASTLDKLVIRHEFAFADVYAPLRVVARARTPRLDLEESFWEHAHWAAWHARNAAADRSNPDPGPMQEWKSLAMLMPRLSKPPLKYRALRITRGIQRRAKRWMARSPGRPARSR